MASDKQPEVLPSLETCKQALEQKCEPEKFRIQLGLQTHPFHNETASFLRRGREEQNGKKAKSI